MIRGRIFVLALAWVPVGGCVGASSGEDDEASSEATSAGSATTTATTTQTSAEGTVTSAGSEAGSGGSSSGVDGSSGGETGNVGRGEVRFVAFGDAGEGNEGQYAVAGAVGTICNQRGCDFALYLGDNFYDTGVASPMDMQFQTKFEMPYANLDLPFQIVLGNHDYGQIGNEWDKSQHEIDYTAMSEKWNLPNEWYAFDQGNAHFIVMDTNRLLWDVDTEPQREFLRQEIEAGQGQWIIMAGHHPYISNGEHGNAGNYEGLSGVPLVGGAYIKEFFDAEMCGQVHVYLCGHDHNRQTFEQTCGTEFFVSGAGSKTTGFAHRDDNPTLYEDDTEEGFLYVEIIDNELNATFYDSEGNIDHERTITL
jgi:hypothetical protein